MKYQRIAVLLLTGALAACTLEPVAPSAGADFTGAATVLVGNALRFPDGLLVKLERIDDSRCRPNVQCIWAGQLSATLLLRGGALPQEQTLTLGTQRVRAEQAGAYGVELIDATESSAALRVTRRD
jgi:hypothetical protein